MTFPELSHVTPLEELISLELPGAALGSGKDATAYDTAPGLVYRKGHPLSHLTTTVLERIGVHLSEEVETYASLPQETQVSRTIIAWFSEGRIHKIIEKALGNPLFDEYEAGTFLRLSFLKDSWEKGIASMAAVPQNHFDKVVRDEAELRDRQIFMDYLGPQNLFYDKDKGFTIIDAEFKPQFPLRGRSMYSAFLDVNTLLTLLGRANTWTDSISSEARSNTITVLQKLARAGHKPEKKLMFGMLAETIDYQPSY